MPGPRECTCHNITTLDQPPRMMKHTLYSKHHTNIAPLLADTTKESLKAVHTAAVSKSRRKQTVNRVLRDRPPDISETETHSEDRKGQLSPSFARVIAIC